MTTKTAITELTIDLPGQQIKLSPENARKLYTALGELFAAETKPDLAEVMKQLQELKDKPNTIFVYPPAQPIIIDRPPPQSWPYWPGQPWYVGDLPYSHGPTCVSGAVGCSTLTMDLRG